MLKIVGFGHQKQVGKDTIARILREKHYGKSRRVAFADGVKAKAAHLYGLPWELVTSEDKDQIVPGTRRSLRAILQEVGQTERLVDPDYWITYAFGGQYPENQDNPMLNGVPHKEIVANYLKRAEQIGLQIITVTDVRYKNEARFIKSLGGIVVKVDRPAREDDGDQHPSEVSMLNYPFDYNLVNLEGRAEPAADLLYHFIQQEYGKS
jgi:hypothetical protein